MAKLESSWNVHRSAGEPHSVIHVSNLHVNLPTVRDAWGRYPKSQPALISCAVSLRQPFNSTSLQDAVTESTVHYGTLSKVLIEACNRFSSSGLVLPMRLGLLLQYIQSWLTGITSVDDCCLEMPSNPLLKNMGIQLLSLEIMLPKASLLGSGIKMQGAFQYDNDNIKITSYSMILEICHLKIPATIGVNQNERLAKQVVVVSVIIDCYDKKLDEEFYDLEQITVKTIEASSFQTLEALGKFVGQKIYEKYLYPLTCKVKEISVSPTIRLRLSKPTAITLADAPIVEMLVERHKTPNTEYI